MNRSKLWAVVGCTDGLGPAVIRFLLDRKQLVIAITCGETTTAAANGPAEAADDPAADVPHLETVQLSVTGDAVSCTCLQRLTQEHGKIDVLVDNYKSPAVMRFLLPYVSSEGRIIVAPPQASPTISTSFCL